MKVVLSGIFYPMAILRYFEAALQRREDVELITIGAYTGTWIPWKGGMNLLPKYDKPPTYVLPVNFTGRTFNAFIPDKLKEDKADLWIQCDAGFYFAERPPAETVVHIATDPHVLNYGFQRTTCDHFFNMQDYYSEAEDIYLPYAADPVWHEPMETEKIYDACIIGLHYENRNHLVHVLRQKGYNVYYNIGDVFDEYRLKNCQSKVIINWSSKKDLIARVFEAMSMAVPLVTNHVPDLTKWFAPGAHCLVFETMAKAVEQVEWVLNHPVESQVMAGSASRLVRSQHLYDHRINQIFEVVGL